MHLEYPLTLARQKYLGPFFAPTYPKTITLVNFFTSDIQPPSFCETDSKKTLLERSPQ
jgi:hypothetical protein